MKPLTNEERYLIERGLGLLCEELQKEASIYESAYSEIDSEFSESVGADMGWNVRYLQRLARECELLIRKLDSMQKGES